MPRSKLTPEAVEICSKIDQFNKAQPKLAERIWRIQDGMPRTARTGWMMVFPFGIAIGAVFPYVVDQWGASSRQAVTAGTWIAWSAFLVGSLGMLFWPGFYHRSSHSTDLTPQQMLETCVKKWAQHAAVRSEWSDEELEELRELLALERRLDATMDRVTTDRMLLEHLTEEIVMERTRRRWREEKCI